MSDHPLVMVTWRDTVNASNWKSAADVDTWAAKDDWFVYSIGWLVRETGDFYVLAGSWARQENYYCGLIKIPKPWATKIVILEASDGDTTRTNA